MMIALVQSMLVGKRPGRDRCISRDPVAIMALSLLLMRWICLSAAVSATAALSDDETNRLQPCSFNPLCRCTRSGPELGKVFCEDVPLADLPVAINNSKAFVMHLRRNGLRRLEDNLFQGTGLWMIEIRSNQLYSIPEMAFTGLERSLAELHLPWNNLQNVPQRAIRNLQRLRVLDLTGNQIDEIGREDFVGLEQSLQVLSLAENSIKSLELDVLQNLMKLEKLDVRGNSIMTVSGTPPPRLTNINLYDNALERIPFESLSKVRSLQIVNLGRNKISSTFDVAFQGKLTLDTLILDNNIIDNLPPFSFQNFNIVNRTSLSGNRIDRIEENAFKEAKIRELSLSQCDLDYVEQKAFHGLEASLERLDLSLNNLTSLPQKLFENFDNLKAVMLNDNPLAFKPEDVFDGFRYTLHTLNLVGEKMHDIPIRQLHDIRNLRHMGLSSLDDSDVAQQDFEGFGAALESLNLSKNRLKSISARAFRHVSAIKTLDLSDNRISQIDNAAFDDIANSLNQLIVTNGLKMSSLAAEPFKKLVAVRSVDFSGNKLTQVSADLFHAMKELRTVNMQDGNLERIPAHLFQHDHTPHLDNIMLGFNQIAELEPQTFADLAHVRTLHLEDNRIASIKRGAFQNMKCLNAIHLEGNQISDITAEAFQNLPKLESLNLAYNRLTQLSFDWLDQVGTLSALRLDVSHNAINQLTVNRAGYTPYTSVRSLNLAHNNISQIARGFFEPVRSSLTQLVLHKNRLRSVTRDLFADMQHLLWLDLSDNDIQSIDSDSFFNTKNMQILLLDGNELTDIHQDVLGRASNLRVANFSHNQLRNLPDNLFRETIIEVLDISHNRMVRLPDGALVRIASTLRQLDASYNEFYLLSPDQIKKLTNLVYLDLSYNNLTTLADNTFSTLNRLTFLDLSGNDFVTLSEKLFDNVLPSMAHLKLADTGITSLRDFYLPSLITFNVSHNNIENVPSDFTSRFANLRELDISYCQLSNRDDEPVWPGESKLRALYLNGNQLTSLVNDSLSNLKHLEYLNIQSLPIDDMDEDILEPMESLRHLAIGTYPALKKFDIAEHVAKLPVLRHLDVEVQSSSLERQLRGQLSPKIGNITLRGELLKSIGNTAFKDVQSRSLTLTLRKTGITDIPRAVFHNMGLVRWLQLDLKYNRISSVAEPSTTIFPGASNTVFLTHVEMANNDWKCDCTTGWVEFWLRMWKRHLCRDRCDMFDATMDDLRTAQCRNRDKPLLDALKTDLECGWSAAERISSGPFTWLLVLLVGYLSTRQLISLA